MDNAMNLGKRAFALAVVTATIVWSVGLAAFAVPTVQAAAAEGDLIKGTSLSTVYYFGHDGFRYTFPNEKTFFSWFSGFSGVEVITDGDLADIPLAGNIVVRPGTYWVKITSNPKTYVVSTEGTIRWVESGTTAVDFAGSNWNVAGSTTTAGVIDVPDAFFVDYTEGASLMSATAFDGMLYMDGGDYFLAWNGEKRMITSAGMTANHYQSKFFLDGTGIDDSALDAGADITAEISALTDVSQQGGTVETGGNLSVSLASSTPAQMSIPDSASGVEVATFKMTAGSATVLNSLTVELTGLATSAEFLNVYLYEGSARLTDGRSVNSQTRQATFAGLSLDFAAGQTHNISVVVDMDTSGAGSGSFAFKIASADAVDSDGSVSGSFPVTGKTMTIENITVGDITIEKTGSITNPVLGQADATVAKFKLTAGSAEDVDINRITLKIEDAADHSEFQLWQGSTWIADGEYIGDKLVLFDFTSPYFLAQGNNRTFTVTLKVGGNIDDTISVYLDNTADLYAVGRDFGFGVTVTSGAYDNGSNDGTDSSDTTIQGGEITVAFNGPAASDVKNGADDVALFDFSITAERWAEVQTLSFIIDGTDLSDTDPALTGIQIVNADTGALVSGPEELVDATDSQTIPFADNWVILAGQTLDLSVTADIDDTVAAANDTYTVTLDMSTLSLEDESGDAITDIVPSSDLTGYAQTVKNAGLTVSLASTPTGDTTYVKGTNGVSVVGYNFTAATGSDLIVTDLAVSVYVDEDSEGTFVKEEEDGSDGDAVTTKAADRISSCSLYDSADSSLIAGPESIDAAGELLFESFSWAIGAGDTEKVLVKCNLANVAPGTADEFAFEIDEDDDVSAEDDAGESLTLAEIAGDPVNAAEAVKISIAAAGTLTVTAAPDAPSDDVILAGATNVTVSKFRFDAATEAFTVNRLTVTEEQAEADNATVDSDAYANNVAKVTISYPTSTGTTATAFGSLTGNEITFNGMTFYIAKDDDATVTVKMDASVSDRHSGSATSNERVRLGLSSDAAGADDQVQAVGASSGTTLDDDDVTTIADGNTAQGTFVVRETKPTVTLSSSSPSGSNKVPGDQEMMRVNVAANAGEDVVLNQLVFQMSTTDNAATDWNFCDTDASGAGAIDEPDFDLYNLNTTGPGSAIDAESDWTILDSTGAACSDSAEAVGFVRVAFDDENVVPAGLTYSYALYFDSSDSESAGASSSSDDSVQFKLMSDPIVSTYLAASDVAAGSVGLARTTTSLVVGAASTYEVGDVLCLDVGDDGCGAADEKLLVVVDGGATLTVVRGYLESDPSTPALVELGDNVDRLPGAFLWEDDGNEADLDATQELWGAFLVDDLPVTGNAIGF